MRTKEKAKASPTGKGTGTGTCYICGAESHDQAQCPAVTVCQRRDDAAGGTPCRSTVARAKVQMQTKEKEKETRTRRCTQLVTRKVSQLRRGPCQRTVAVVPHGTGTDTVWSGECLGRVALLSSAVIEH